MQHKKAPFKFSTNWFWAICILGQFCIQANAQNNLKKRQDSPQQKTDTSKSILDINNSKLIKKANSILDSNQKKVNDFILNKVNKIKGTANDKANKIVGKVIPLEIEKPLPYERLLKTKYTLGRRAYQNTVSQFNFLFNAEQELNEFILKARNEYVDDYTTLISFYDYDLSSIAKNSIDSIIYRCNANIVLHDLRSNWVDDAYLLLARAYLFHKDFDTAGSILQFINYSFDDKENGMDLPIGSNMRNTKGKFSIATAENNRFFENVNVRNESMIWQARNYIEKEELNEGISLLQLLESDALFPKRLYPFLNEQLAYGYYQMEIYDKAAAALEKGIENAPDAAAKTRWYYLIGQLWQKAERWDKAYPWFKKANQNAVNPIVSVYAKISMISYDAKNSNNAWEELAFSLEKMTKRDKYKPYADIIYFEMAKLAIQNNAYIKANDWLIQSIRKNRTNLKQKQKAFELLGDINYSNNHYNIAKLAYDSVSTVLKTNPNYETIQARKKWLSTISHNEKIIEAQDTLQYIYQLNPSSQNTYFNTWQRKQKIENEFFKDIFLDKITGPNYSIEIPTKINFSGNENNSTNFYFDNKSAVLQGKQIFTQKWGQRPNVDGWRRKTNLMNSPGSIINQDASNTGFSNISNKDSLQKMGLSKDVIGNSKADEKSNGYEMITDESSFMKSKQLWNKAVLSNAQTFLLELNDFERAYPLYIKVIANNIDTVITERAMLDLASYYLHENLNEKSDSIIKLVEIKFPHGFYNTKKKESSLKKKREDNLLNDYKEAYFLSQIGNWESLAALSNQLNIDLRKTKWYTPYKFIQVKMYAQQRMDTAAIELLDSIVLQNTNEKIRDKAKNILSELKNRNQTESYLSNLNINKELLDTSAQVNSAVTKIDSSSNFKVAPQITSAIKTSAIKTSIDTSLKVAITTPPPAFTNDSTEQYYIAFATQKVSATFVKEMQTAFTYLNNDEFIKQKLNVTYIQFNENSYIVWIGPFVNSLDAKTYINKVKPRLSTEIISFVPSKQYEIYLLSKSNILLIKDEADLKQYQQYMFKNIYKP
ncbi:MAG: tetratricopeptide repeat protein [Chitinophagia bacterium]|nr:tetratricopeptide repeat protein [Chitinophagia bacterium]